MTLCVPSRIHLCIFNLYISEWHCHPLSFLYPQIWEFSFIQAPGTASLQWICKPFCCISLIFLKCVSYKRIIFCLHSDLTLIALILCSFMSLCLCTCHSSYLEAPSRLFFTKFLLFLSRNFPFSSHLPLPSHFLLLSHLSFPSWHDGKRLRKWSHRGLELGEHPRSPDVGGESHVEAWRWHARGFIRI